MLRTRTVGLVTASAVRQDIAWKWPLLGPVPARMIGRTLRVFLRASEVLVFDGRTQIACHPRVVAVDGQSVYLLSSSRTFQLRAHP